MSHKITHCEKITKGYPSIWEAKDSSDQYIFIRYKNGVLRVTKAPDVESALNDGNILFELQYGDKLSNTINTNEMMHALDGIIDFKECTFKEFLSDVLCSLI